MYASLMPFFISYDICIRLFSEFAATSVDWRWWRVRMGNRSCIYGLEQKWLVWEWGMLQLAPEWVRRSQRISFGWKWGRTSQSVGGTLGSWQDMRWDFLQQIICLKLAPVSSVRTPHHQHYHKQLHHLRWWHMPTSVGRSVNRNGEDFPATDEDIPLLWPCTRFTDGDRRDNLGDERAMVMVMIHWRNQLCCRPSPKSFRVICSSIAKRGLKGLFTNF